jgi:signal transduction histidine kinase
MAADGGFSGLLGLLARAGSLRVRTTVGASFAVAAALIGGAVVVSAVQTRTLTDNIDSSLEVRADDIGTSLADGSLPSVLSVRDIEEALVQVVGPDGRVVAASANVEGRPLLIEGFAPDGARELRTFDELPIDDDPFRVIAQRVEAEDGVYTVYVAETLEAVRESAAVLNRTLFLAVPLLVLLVAALTWFVVGRALSPVEAIRAEVAAISGDDLRRRVPEPASTDEIGRLARTMNAMLTRLETAQERQRRFVADASHELRSPLANIRAQLEVDLARPVAARPLETEQAVLEEAVRLERLVDDLLQLARADDSRALRLEPVDLDDVVFREIERARAGAPVEIDARGVSGAQLLGDRDQLTRAVRNLLENAVRHARERVAVSLSEDATGIALTVADDGPGIPPEARERIFERFARLDEGRARDAGGSGLGLSITRDVVVRHGGAVTVDPDYARGARFVIRIPAEGGTGSNPPGPAAP